MKTVKLNKDYSASKIGRRVYFHQAWDSGFTYVIQRWGVAVTKRAVERALAGNDLRGRRVYNDEYLGKRSIPRTYSVHLTKNYIKVGCQRFTLTAAKRLLSLFS